MTLKLSVQFTRAMKRAKNERKHLANDFGVDVWITALRHEKTCEKVSALTRKVKALKAKRAAAIA